MKMSGYATYQDPLAADTSAAIRFRVLLTLRKCQFNLQTAFIRPEDTTQNKFINWDYAAVGCRTNTSGLILIAPQKKNGSRPRWSKVDSPRFEAVRTLKLSQVLLEH